MAVNSFNAQNPPVNTKGDLFTFSTIPTKLGVGANNTVLTADSTAATGLKWGTVSAGANWSLLNAGGTALTGATTVTVSGISAADKIMVLVEGASSASSTFISVRFNADTGTSYYQYGVNMEWSSAYSAAIGGNLGSALDRIRLGLMSNSTSSAVSGYVLLSGANTSGKKVFNCAGSGSPFSSNSQQSYITGGYYDSSSTISSVSIVSSSGNLDAGTVYVYTSA